MPRTTRSDEVKQERRRRTSSASGRRTRLTLDESQLDKNYEYRWIKNTPERVSELTVHDDWDFVQDRDNKIKSDGTGMGADVSIHAGVGANGASEKLVLVRKLKAYADEDRAAKAAHIDRTENSLRQGDLQSSEAASGPNFYQPKSGGIQIES